MSTDAMLEAVSAEGLRAELMRMVAARLAPDKPRPDVVIGDEHDFEAKNEQIARREFLEAVHGALRELLGTARLFIVHDSDPALAKVVSAVIEQLPDVVASRRRALSERNIEALVDVFLGADPLASAMPAIDRDNAAAQAAFLKRWPVLTAEAVAKQADHASSNRSATASRWKKAGKIFGVRVSGRDAYPSFQFQDGRPRPIIAKVLAALPETMTGWQSAFWFTGSNSWLEGSLPVDLLTDEAGLVAAARHEREAWMG
ncbi:MAG: hypothetical protein JO312_14265 [Hyphomicrobiales bacterium]|nr:hypothetical protein [Hyphomicrobiales bacterium]